MAEFMLLTRIYESTKTGEREMVPFIVNLASVRSLRPNEARGTTWIRWDAPDVLDTEIAESFELLAGVLTDGP
jgi:hypothetical protein